MLILLSLPLASFLTSQALDNPAVAAIRISKLVSHNYIDLLSLEVIDIGQILETSVHSGAGQVLTYISVKLHRLPEIRSVQRKRG